MANDLLQQRAARGPAWPSKLAPDALNEIDVDTPFLATDCDEVARRLEAFDRAMHGIRPFFALKCNSAKPVLATLAERGAGFEIASVFELDPLQAVGVAPYDVLFSNTVKPEQHIRLAAARGVWRFALDSESELRKLADVAPGHALDEASNDVRKMFAELGMPPTMSFRLQGQSKILDETTANLILAISLAMIFVYMVLASQFESFLQPIVIMLSLPIAVPFALFTLWVTGRTLNLWSALGMLLLLGIGVAAYVEITAGGGADEYARVEIDASGMATVFVVRHLLGGRYG